MNPALSRPPLDPEMAAFLTANNWPSTMTMEMIPVARQYLPTAEQADEQLKAHNIVRHEEVISGHLGEEICVSVLHRADHEGLGPGVLFIHGGGMVGGNRYVGIEERAVPVILEHDAVAVSVEYRLAPEFPDPYPVEDCYAALTWMARNAERMGIDAARLMVLGGSAGGGLAAGTALLARDRSGPALMGMVLYSPMIDDRNDTLSAQQIDGVGVWDRSANLLGWTCLLGDRRGTDDVSVYAAPARLTDFSGLPPTFLDCGSFEVFRDEVIAFANGLWAAGCAAELHVWAGGFHGYESVRDAAVTRGALAARESWIARLMANSAGG